MPSCGKGRIGSAHRASDYRNSRQLSFRQTGFSETNFRYWGFSETVLPGRGFQKLACSQLSAITLGFLIHHALGPGVQLLRLSRDVPDGGEAYSPGDGERADHMKGDAALGSALP